MNTCRPWFHPSTGYLQYWTKSYHIAPFRTALPFFQDAVRDQSWLKITIYLIQNATLSCRLPPLLFIPPPRFSYNATALLIWLRTKMALKTIWCRTKTTIQKGKGESMKGIENQSPTPSGDRRLVQFSGFSIQQFSSSIPYLPSLLFLSPLRLALFPGKYF